MVVVAAPAEHSLHPLAEWGRQRFGGAETPADQRLTDLETMLGLIGLHPAGRRVSWSRRSFGKRRMPGAWTGIERSNPDDPIGQLYGFVEQAAKFIFEDERGCDLANAAVELTDEGHPGLRVIEEFKVRQRDRLAALCRAAGASRPSLLADALILLMEGARVSRRSVGTEGPSANFLRTSEAVLASFSVKRPKRQPRPRPAKDR